MQVWFEGTSSIWVKPITGGRMAVLLFNAGDRAGGSCRQLLFAAYFYAFLALGLDEQSSAANHCATPSLPTLLPSRCCHPLQYVGDPSAHLPVARLPCVTSGHHSELHP